MEKPKQVNPNDAPPHEFLRYVDELETYVNKLEEQLRLGGVVGRSELLCRHDNIGAANAEKMYCKDCKKWVDNE